MFKGINKERKKTKVFFSTILKEWVEECFREWVREWIVEWIRECLGNVEDIGLERVREWFRDEKERKNKSFIFIVFREWVREWIKN